MKVVKSQNQNVNSVIIFVNTDLKEIVERAKFEDMALIESKRKPVWEELHMKQREEFEIPTKDECDIFIEYDGKDWKSILDLLGKLL